MRNEYVNVYRNAFSSNFVVTSTKNHQFIESNLPFIREIVWGGIYKENGELILSSIRDGAYGGDRILSLAPNYMLKKEAHYLRGKSIYLGPLMGHYGHFLIESLSRIILLDLNEFDHVVFSKFTNANSLKSFHTEFLEYFNIKKDKVKIIETMTHFEELYLPEQLWKINRSPNLLVKNIYLWIKKSIQYRKVGKVFLTYSNRDDSRIKNLPEVENVFKKYGFSIIEPVSLSIKEQLSIYKSSEILASVSGTLMHNCLFSSEGAFVIEVGDDRTANDYMLLQKEINRMNNLTANRINYLGIDGKINLKHLEESLANLLRKYEECKKVIHQ